MQVLLLAAAQHETLGGKIFIVLVIGGIFGSLGIWVLRSTFKSPGSLLSKLGQFLLAMLCFGTVVLTLVAVGRGL